jgi:hypothetical protein
VADLSYITVDTPRSAPPTHSLVASADEVVDSSRWIAGLAFDSMGCVEHGGTHFFCPPGTEEGFPVAEGKTDFPDSWVVEYSPYVAYAGDRCSPATFRSRDFVGRARAAYEISESAIMAKELWEGNVAQEAGLPNAYLANGDADVIAGVFSPALGLAALQRTLGEALPGRGMIHAPRDIASLWHLLGMIRREGRLLVDAFDNIIVADTGYSGMGASEQERTDTTAFVYATDPVQIRRDPQVTILPSPDDYAAAMDRDVNLVEWRAERIVAAYWKGCAHIAIEIDLCETDCVSSS